MVILWRVLYLVHMFSIKPASPYHIRCLSTTYYPTECVGLHRRDRLRLDLPIGTGHPNCDEFVRHGLELQMGNASES